MKRALLLFALVLASAAGIPMVRFIIEETERARILSATEEHARLAQASSVVGSHRGRDVFGESAEVICILQSYSSPKEIEGVSDLALRDALSAAPPSDDLSWRILVFTSSQHAWFIQDEINGASPVQSPGCFELNHSMMLIVENAGVSADSSPRTIKFIYEDVAAGVE